jgi:DNA-binding CsgD family transcriptional regulator
LLSSAIERVARLGNAETLICECEPAGKTRYTILLQPNSGAGKIQAEPSQNVACMVFPLGRRRIASARQLMLLFGLSAAEARLARALCHGETLEEYAGSQGVKLPTIKTQLRAVFAKTKTDRQVTLVSLISGIPPLR